MIKVRDDGRKKIFGGVAVLTLSTLAVKITGLLYKIPLIKLVGIEGMAYFLAAYHIYALIFVLSTAGLPVATSVLVSKSLAKENRRETDKAYVGKRRSDNFYGRSFGVVLHFFYIKSDIIIGFRLIKKDASGVFFLFFAGRFLRPHVDSGEGDNGELAEYAAGYSVPVALSQLVARKVRAYEH